MSLALNPVAFNLGPIQVKWYGILMATGVLVATLMAINEGKKRQIMPDDFIDFLLWACLLYTSPSPRDRTRSRMPSSA